MEFGHSALMRRDRLERIAMAERDRRAGRVDVAVASLGAATEWPARAVLALAKLPENEAAQTRQVLEEGLDVWAEEAGLDALDAEFSEVLDGDELEGVSAIDSNPVAADSNLERPIDDDELERAFAEAEAQTDEMHDVNEVAERVLMSESAGISALAGDDLVPADPSNDNGGPVVADVFGMDAAYAPHSTGVAEASASPESRDAEAASFEPSRDVVLATLSKWLVNIEQGLERRARRPE